MSKYCIESYNFEDEVNRRMEKIAKLQKEVESAVIEIKKLKKEVKGLAMKGNCTQCQHRV